MDLLLCLFEKKKIVIFISRLKTWLSHRDIADLIGLVPDRNNKVQKHSPYHHHYPHPHQNQDHLFDQPMPSKAQKNTKKQKQKKLQNKMFVTNPCLAKCK